MTTDRLHLVNYRTSLGFPMDYPIKLIGNAGDELQWLFGIFYKKHFPEFDGAYSKIWPSYRKIPFLTAQLRF